MSAAACAVDGCAAPMLPVRWDCRCGCGKSWCASHGAKRKRAEFPGQVSHLVRVVDSAYRQRKDAARRNA